MQFLANKPSHVKENYMKNFDSFISKQRDLYVQFLSKLCDVDDFYTDLEVSTYCRYDIVCVY